MLLRGAIFVSDVETSAAATSTIVTVIVGVGLDNISDVTGYKAVIWLSKIIEITVIRIPTFRLEIQA